MNIKNIKLNKIKKIATVIGLISTIQTIGMTVNTQNMMQTVKASGKSTSKIPSSGYGEHEYIARINGDIKAYIKDLNITGVNTEEDFKSTDVLARIESDRNYIVNGRNIDQSTKQKAESEYLARKNIYNTIKDLIKRKIDFYQQNAKKVLITLKETQNGMQKIKREFEQNYLGQENGRNALEALIVINLAKALSEGIDNETLFDFRETMSSTKEEEYYLLQILKPILEYVKNDKDINSQNGNKVSLF